MKKIGILLTTIIMMVLLVVSASAATEGYYTYEVENGEAIITDVDELISGDVVIPETLGGYPVTTIDDFVFNSVQSIESLYIPKTLVNFGVESTNSGSFCYCARIKNYIVDEENPNFISENGIIYNKDKTVLVAYPAGREAVDFVIPATVKSFDRWNGSGARFKTLSFEDGCQLESWGIGFFYFGQIENVIVPSNADLEQLRFDSMGLVETYTFEYGEEPKVLPTKIGVHPGGYGAPRNWDLSSNFVKIEKDALRLAVETVIIRNPNCEIYDNPDTINKSATIYGYENSTAQTYAEKYNRTFVALDCAHPDYEYKFIEADGCNNAYECYKCTICGDIKDKKEFTDTATHLYEKEVTPPTCSVKGFTTYICECGDTYVDNYVNTVNHKDDNGDYECDYSCGYEFEKPAPDITEEPEKELTVIEKVIEWFKNIFDKLFGWIKR